QVAQAVPQQYSYDVYAATFSEQRIVDTFRIVKDMAALYQNEVPEVADPKIERLKRDLQVEIKDSSLTVLLVSTPESLRKLETTTRHLVYKIMKDGVREDSLPQAREQLRKEIERLPNLSPDEAQAVAEIGGLCMMANKAPDPEATIKAQQEAMKRVKPVTKTILKDYKIVPEGTVVTPEQMSDLEACGLTKPSMDIWLLAGYSLLIGTMMTLVAVYLRRQQKAVYESGRMLALTGILVVSVAAVSRYLVVLSPYLTPVVTASILLALLVETRLALLSTVFLSCLIGVQTENLSTAVVALITGVAGLLAVSRANQRSSLITASLIVVFANALGTVIFSMILGTSVEASLREIAFGSLNGLTSALVAVGALPLLENLFGIVTNFRLLEISNPSEPLLQLLLRQAPGTYQHSIMVANLAEAAAQEVGADALRCKVGAYYHDIGKTVVPRYFVENHTGGENPHDQLSPYLSTTIILGHVVRGLELARKYKLPEEIQKFIAEHHGTSLVSYFYHQAVSRSTEPVNEDEFRYPGPKPSSRETAIVMLCDGVEAAARTLPKPTPEAIAELVRKMTRQCLEDGQLDECDLSIKDLTRIQESLIRSLRGIYHSRIEYPEASSLATARRQNVTTLRKKA
ncbi:MAG: HDIG domain-containing metalloprotein, partial [Candidatus Eremiobacterota bacterium]